MPLKGSSWVHGNLSAQFLGGLGAGDRVATQQPYARDVKSHLLLSHLDRGSETRCSFNVCLPVQAKLATARSEAIGTMKSFEREGKAAR